MSAPEGIAARARRALDALLPHALIVPLLAGLAFLASAAVAVLGTGGLVAGFVATLQQIGRGGAAGHGYGIILAVAFWAAAVAAGGAALALFVVVATTFAASAGMLLSGLIDLARLPRTLPRDDARWPKLVGARAAALSAAACVLLALAARMDLGRVNAAHVFCATLGGAALTAVAIAFGYALRARARR